MVIRKALGVDLGSRRIGIAFSAGAVAVPYDMVPRRDDKVTEHAEIARLVEESGAQVVIVGLPRSLTGFVGPAEVQAAEEAAELARCLDVPVRTWDERMTTVSAERSLREQNMSAKKRRKVVDSVAAAVILQSWLDAGEQM